MPDSTVVHEAVIDVLGDWEHPVTDKREFVRRLTEFLDTELADRGLDVTVERTPQASCDITVDGSVGVLVYLDFSHSNSVRLQSESDRFRENYETLVVYGYMLPNRDLDRWRIGEVKHKAMGLKLDEVTFVRRNPETESTETTSNWQRRFWQFTEAVVALLAIVIGLELAVLYQAFGGAVPSASVTFVIVIVLSTLLVFLYERILL